MKDFPSLKNIGKLGFQVPKAIWKNKSMSVNLLVSIVGLCDF
jgi:hypothetical protein